MRIRTFGATLYEKPLEAFGRRCVRNSVFDASPDRGQRPMALSRLQRRRAEVTQISAPGSQPYSWPQAGIPGARKPNDMGATSPMPRLSAGLR